MSHDINDARASELFDYFADSGLDTEAKLIKQLASKELFSECDLFDAENYLRLHNKERYLQTLVELRSAFNDKTRTQY